MTVRVPRFSQGWEASLPAPKTNFRRTPPFGSGTSRPFGSQYEPDWRMSLRWRNPKAIFIIAVVKLWRKKGPFATGIVLSAVVLAVHVAIHVATH